MIKSTMMHLPNIFLGLKTRREALKISQETLAGISGVGLRTLKQIERGKGNPTLGTLHRLMEVLGMELELKVKN